MWLSCTSYGIKMSSASVLNYAEDGCRETGWPPRGHYRGLGQCLCAACRSRGEKNGPDAHAWNLQKTTFTIKHMCNNNALHDSQTCKAGTIRRQGEDSNSKMSFGRYCSSGDFWKRLVCCFMWCRLSSGCSRCEHRFEERWKLGNDKNHNKEKNIFMLSKTVLPLFLTAFYLWIQLQAGPVALCGFWKNAVTCEKSRSRVVQSPGWQLNVAS